MMRPDVGIRRSTPAFSCLGFSPAHQERIVAFAVKNNIAQKNQARTSRHDTRSWRWHARLMARCVVK